jgi:hypothetical protein
MLPAALGGSGGWGCGAPSKPLLAVLLLRLWLPPVPGSVLSLRTLMGLSSALAAVRSPLAVALAGASILRATSTAWLGSNWLAFQVFWAKRGNTWPFSGILPFLIDFCDFLPMKFKSCTELYFSSTISYIS